MEIEIKQNKNCVLFENVEAGDVFEYNNYYYIKMDKTLRFEGADYNVVDLNDGEPRLFLNKTVVFVPSAKLIIE